MILWINGAFGSGKTQTAYELHRRMPCSTVYDPENAGFFIRENLPKAIRKADFQDYPMWRAFNFAMLAYLSENFDGDILVPMTLTNRAYYDELVGALSEKHDVRHVILCASRETLLKRLASRLEGRKSWAARQIDRCLSAFESDIPGERIQTDGKRIGQVAECVAEAVGVPLAADRRTAFRRCYDRLATQLRHIR